MNKTIFTLLTLLSSQFLVAQPCTPSSSAGCNLDYISYFSLKGDGGTEIQSPSACSAGAYADYTATFAPVTMSKGNCYTGFIQTSHPNDFITIWIDEDNDLIFEDQERLIHNLNPGNSKLLYGIFIPSSWSSGQHRMRVRLSYYASTPAYTTLTDPCNLITFSETEDYLVNVTNVGASYSVSSGLPGFCTEAAVVSIGTATNNANAISVQVKDSNNNFICNIYPSGNTLGHVKTTLYVHNGPVRQDSKGIHMIDRNFTIEPEFAPVSPYNLRYFYLNSELNSLIAQPGSGVTSQFDLAMTKNQQIPCATQVSSAVPLGSLIFPNGFGSTGSDRFVDMTNLTSFSTFYLHGGSTALGNPAISLDAQPINLNVKGNAENIILNWTASPDQSASFELQRSEDGIDFRTIHQIQSESGFHSFSYTDQVSVSDILYYRIRMQLADGRSYFSMIESYTKKNIQEDNIQLLQNPVTENLLVRFAKESNIRVFNSIGQLVLAKQVGEGIQSIPIGHLSAGMYSLVYGNQRLVFVKSN